MSARDQGYPRDPGMLFDVQLPDTEASHQGHQGHQGHQASNRQFGFEDGESFDLQEHPESRENGSRGSRRPIPVATISRTSRFMMPYSGLQFLSGLDRVDIQQTVELQDLLASVESENRYVVKSADLETVFVAAETSASVQRLCLGSSRALQLRVYDASRQETLHLSRRLACKAGMFGCYLQRLDVIAPPGRFLGCVRQEWTLLVPALQVEDAAGNVQYRIEGPRHCVPQEAVFKISSRDGLLELGSISHQWSPSQSTYTMTIIFPDANLDVVHKSLLLGAAFLLEYMFFETSKKKSWLPCSWC